MINPLNKRPRQPPLNREAQEKSFQELRNQYSVKPPETPPVFPVQAQKIEKPGETTQLQQYQKMLEERGMKIQATQVEEHVKENQTSETIKQFYCSHVFTPVKATFMSMPIRYKICNKCSLVK